MKRFVFMLALVFLLGKAFAAETSDVPKAFLEDPFNHPSLSLYVAISFSIVVLALVIFVVAYVQHVLRVLSLQVQDSNGQQQDKSKRLSALKSFLPPWWSGLLYTTLCGSIVTLFGFFYLSSDSIAKEGDQVRTLEASLQTTKDIASDNSIDEEGLVFTRDSTKAIESGKTIFNSYNCGSCHRNDGGGNAIGPNLTDEYWLHGGNIKDVQATIKNGVPTKGMPAWGGALSPKDLRNVAFFVLSLQGTNPVDAKQSQGNPYKMTSN